MIFKSLKASSEHENSHSKNEQNTDNKLLYDSQINKDGQNESTQTLLPQQISQTSTASDKIRNNYFTTSSFYYSGNKTQDLKRIVLYAIQEWKHYYNICLSDDVLVDQVVSLFSKLRDHYNHK